MSFYMLSDVKVLDFSRVLAGPYASRLLSDLGADVIKIEPPEGDMTRFLGKKNGEMSGFYIQQNTGKRNVCIDLKAEGARDLILELVKAADLVIENFRPGVMDKFGIGWKDLSAVKPSLVMLSISGFGQEGPEAKRAAYAPIIHAESGLLARSEETSGRRGDIPLSIADTFSSLHGLIGTLTALRHAEKTGEGQHVDIAMMKVMHSSDDFAHYALDEVWPKVQEGFIWEAPENKQILISGDMKWLWHVFSTQDGLTANVDTGVDLATKLKARHQAMAAYVAGFASFQALTDRLDELNLAWGIVRSFGEDSYSQPTIKASDIIREVVDETGETRRVMGAPYSFSNALSGLKPGLNPAKRGEHNSQALQDWLGYDEDRVTALSQRGVLQAQE